MYDKELSLDILLQIDMALSTLKERFKLIETISDYTDTPIGLEKLDDVCNTKIKPLSDTIKTMILDIK